MKRHLLKISSFILSIYIVLSIITISASSVGFQTSKYPYVYVSCGNYNRYFSVINFGYNMNRTLNSALATAGSKASEERKAYVYVSEGNYEITDTLLIYSHTVLIATDAVFSGNCNMLRNGFDNEETSATRYNGALDIIVNGGTWKMNVPYELASSTDPVYVHSTFRFAHCKKIYINNCTFRNNYNAHDIELGGVYKATVKNCTFVNDKSVNKFKKVFGKEAIQIDVNTPESMPHIPEYDYTASETIFITECSFTNKFTAVGSHNGIIGNPYTNIKITGNTFTNIACMGISGAYWYNTEIGDNVFENTGSGIELYSVSKKTSGNIKNRFNYAYDDIIRTIKNSRTFIYGNSVNIRSEDNFIEKPFGIKVSGSKFTEDNTRNNLKKGTYYFYNLFMNYSPYWKYATNTVSGNAEENIIINKTK